MLAHRNWRMLPGWLYGSQLERYAHLFHCKLIWQYFKAPTSEKCFILVCVDVFINASNWFMYFFKSNGVFFKGFLTSLWICFVTSVEFSFKMNNRYKTINPYLASFGFCNAVADWPHGIWIEIVITGFSRNCSASLWFNGVGDQKKKKQGWLQSVYCCTTTHSNAHVHILGGDTGHTHAGRGRREFDFCIFPSRTVLPPGPQEQWAAFKRPGTRWGEPSVLVRDRRRVFCSFACFFCWGF